MAAERISSYDSQITYDLKKAYEKVSYLGKFFKIFDQITRSEIVSAIMSYIFVNQILYYFTVKKLKEDKGEIMEATKELGRLDALLAVVRFREEARTDGVSLCKSNIINKKKYIEIKDMVHPLVDNCVANSITLDEEGAIITGSNMSGKSTFIKTAAVNAVLAQCFGFALARYYNCSYFNIMTSISPKDDISGKKSYFLSEAETVKRIIKISRDKEGTGLFIIDEIFRGTNPGERIASSVAIIDYLNEGNNINLISTHDMDIVKMVKTKWKKLHFSEDIKEKEINFDYKIKDGVAQGTNALKILEILNYPKELTMEAKELVEEIRNKQ